MIPAAQRPLKSVRRAFTLVEMLVVIGIIVLLVGILLPTVMSIRRSADKSAVRMELHTIGLALEAYKADFGDYPRPPENLPNGRKYRLLAWALIGPYDGGAGPPTDPLAASKPLVDGADGPGFRTAWDNTTKKGSKIWGPYLAPDKFRVATPAVNLDFPTTPADLRWDILDRYGSPIEYFPRWRTYQAGQNLFGTNTTNAATATYDFQQQWQANEISAKGIGRSGHARNARERCHRCPGRTEGSAAVPAAVARAVEDVFQRHRHSNQVRQVRRDQQPPALRDWLRQSISAPPGKRPKTEETDKNVCPTKAQEQRQ